METNKPDRSKEGVSLLVLFLILSIFVLAVATIYPPFVKAREGIAVESAANELKYCNDAIDGILRTDNTVTNASDITLERINIYLTDIGKRTLIWPAQARTASFVPCTTNGPAIDLVLQSGVRTVTTDDIAPKN